MHFRHRQTDRQINTDIIAYARDVYGPLDKDVESTVHKQKVICRTAI